MADISKSDLIRNILKRKPGSTAKDIREAIAKSGVEVTDNLIYNILRENKEKSQNAAPTEAKAEESNGQPSSNGKVDHATPGTIASVIHETRSLAMKVGGWGELKELVEALAE